MRFFFLHDGIADDFDTTSHTNGFTWRSCACSKLMILAHVQNRYKYIQQFDLYTQHVHRRSRGQCVFSFCMLVSQTTSTQPRTQIDVSMAFMCMLKTYDCSAHTKPL